MSQPSRKPFAVVPEARAGQKIKAGGAGTVYHDVQRADMVLKILKPMHRTPEMEAKLHAMLIRPPMSQTFSYQQRMLVRRKRSSLAREASSSASPFDGASAVLGQGRRRSHAEGPHAVLVIGEATAKAVDQLVARLSAQGSEFPTATEGAGAPVSSHGGVSSAKPAVAPLTVDMLVEMLTSKVPEDQVAEIIQAHENVAINPLDPAWAITVAKQNLSQKVQNAVRARAKLAPLPAAPARKRTPAASSGSKTVHRPIANDQGNARTAMLARISGLAVASIASASVRRR
jgi:hypothetical protein